MNELLIIGFTAFFASLLTFFSGFGLGTLLTVAFIQFFPIKQAIIFTSVVHFLNNIFKFLLVRKQLDWKIILSFGLLAIPGAFLGATLLNYLPDSQIFSYEMFGKQYKVCQTFLC